MSIRSEQMGNQPDPAVELVSFVSDKMLSGNRYGLTDWEFRQIYNYLYLSGSFAPSVRERALEALIESGHEALATALMQADCNSISGAWHGFTSARSTSAPAQCAKLRLIDRFAAAFCDEKRRLRGGFTWEATADELDALRRELDGMPLDDQCEVLVRMLRRSSREEDRAAAEVMKRAVQQLMSANHNHFIASLVYDRPKQARFVARFASWVKDLGAWLVWQEILHLWQPPRVVARDARALN